MGEPVSSTGRGSPRESHDYYTTPAWCVHRFLERVDLPAGDWLDPCGGDGAIIRAARSIRPDATWHAIELRGECDAALERLVGRRRVIASYLLASLRPLRVDAIVTNPPYSLAQDFVRKALSEAPHVAMLLRLNFLGSEKRAGFFQRMPPDVYVLPNRPSFARGHTDSCEYGWFVWGPERERVHGRVCVLNTTPKRIRMQERARQRAE
jgi:hypothetical protein